MGAKRKDPAAAAVDFFTNAPPDTARTVFAIVKDIVERRGLLQARKKPSRAGKAERQAEAEAPR